MTSFLFSLPSSSVERRTLRKTSSGIMSLKTQDRNFSDIIPRSCSRVFLMELRWSCRLISVEGGVVAAIVSGNTSTLWSCRSCPWNERPLLWKMHESTKKVMILFIFFLLKSDDCVISWITKLSPSVTHTQIAHSYQKFLDWDLNYYRPLSTRAARTGKFRICRCWLPKMLILTRWRCSSGCYTLF